MSDNPASEQFDASSPNLRGLMIAGFGTVFLFFGIFGTWSAIAPLSSAALAPGVVKVDTNRKTVQHLEGGIVKEIRVRDGDQVEAGQVLVKLEETQARASIDLLRGRRIASLAMQSRLISQRDGKDTLVYPQELLDVQDQPNVAEVLSGQQSIFRTQRKSLAEQTAILQQRISQLTEERRGLEGQIRSKKEQFGLVEEEIDGLEKLVAKGFARKPRLLALKRRRSEIDEELNQHRSGIAQTQQEILAAELKIEELRTRFMDETLKQLREVQQEVFDLNERVGATRDILERTTIVAPQDGTVVGLQVHTIGGVIAPGAAVLDIVPSQEMLVVEAQVDPKDIDSVKKGLPASVRFNAFNMRDTPPVDGYVDSISADRFSDQQSGAAYFQARVVLPEEALKALEGRELVSGMQADVMIVTGERTALDYLLAPLLRSVERSLREE